MTVDLQLVGQIALGALIGAVAGFEAGLHNNDERFWAFLLIVGLAAGLGEALPEIAWNPVPSLLGVPGLIALVVVAIAALELGLWAGGSEAPTRRGR